MQKNVGSQKLIVFAFDSTTNLPKTGDAANITAYASLDYGAVTVLGDTSATEMDATNAKGYYLFDLTQGETNGNTILFSAKSSTANIVVVGAPAVVQTVPSSFVVAPGSAGALVVGGSNAATSFSGLTTGALSCTTITASGAVAFQSTFAVTTSTALGAISGSTLTLSGAVALQSTLAVTGTTTLAAFTVTNALTTGSISNGGTTTLTGAVSLGSTLGVTGTTTLAAVALTTLTASGAVALQSTLTVTGATTLTGAITANNAGNAIALGATEEAAIADALLNRDMATGTDSNTHSARNALRFLRNSWAISGTTLTVTKEDQTTPAWTGTVGTTPGANPVTGNTTT